MKKKEKSEKMFPEKLCLEMKKCQPYISPEDKKKAEEKEIEAVFA